MPILYEDTDQTFQETNLKGWSRTTVLAIGSGVGVLGTAELIHLYKKGRPEKGPRGWTRTGVLALGAFTGTMGTAYAIHLIKGGTP